MAILVQIPPDLRQREPQPWVLSRNDEDRSRNSVKFFNNMVTVSAVATIGPGLGQCVLENASFAASDASV
jgi:hypothetical protein